ncbi:MAG: hypothetical protein ACR2MD_07510 [Aridibacter sp.]|jgi:hypothetical protein
MTHSITLELPESVYRTLDEEAKAKGRKVEEIALEKLENGETKEIEDPFENLSVRLGAMFPIGRRITINILSKNWLKI